MIRQLPGLAYGMANNTEFQPERLKADTDHLSELMAISLDLPQALCETAWNG